MTCEIKSEVKKNREHFVVYINGKFYCTADNVREAAEDIEEYCKGDEKNA